MASTHVSKQFLVQAIAITVVAGGGLTLTLADSTSFTATSAMIARRTPVAGDYLVTQTDGYQYIAEKSMFESQFNQIPAPVTVSPVDSVTHRIQLQGVYQVQP